MLKLKDGFILREVAGEIVVVPSGNELDLNMMITLNSTGRFLWQLLENGTSKENLISALLSEYEVDEVTAKLAVEGFVGKLNEHGFLENQ